MQTLLLILLSLITTVYSIPTPPPLHQSHLNKHSLHKNKTKFCQAEEYLEVTRPLPSDSLNPSCTLPVLTHNFSNTYGLPPVSVTYSPPLNCIWSSVTLEIHVSCQGEQYDRIAAVWLNGVELIRTSTAQPTDDGVFWNIRKDVSRYSSLLAQDNLTLSVMLENIVNDVYTGIYQVNVTFLYYDTLPALVIPSIALPGENENYDKISRKLKSVDIPSKLEAGFEKCCFDLYERPSDLIIPISAVGDDGFWFRIQNEMDIHSKGVRIPGNTYRAVLEIYSSSHGDDEFWYSNPPDEYLKMGNDAAGKKNSSDSYEEMKKVGSKGGHGAYREILVKIDGHLVGSVVPFPVIFTGGINPLFWEPLVGIGAFDLPSYDVELTPFLGLLLDGKEHSFSFQVTDANSFWLVNANLHLWLDAGSLDVQVGMDSSEPEFSLEREMEFEGLDGKFEIEAKRETKISGWVNSSAGYFTVSFSQKLKFKNKIKYYNNGASKSVEQKVKDKSELRIKSVNNGLMMFHTNTKREYPLSVDTESLPGWENNSYSMTTSVSTSIEEKKTVGASSSTLKNKQKCSGWIYVKDHEVLAGLATTQQQYSYDDGLQCYSRLVAATNGTLLSDNTSLLCVNNL